MATITLLFTGLLSALIADPVKLPVGFPPQPEENSVEMAAPENCLFFISWAGSAAVDLKKDRAEMSDIERFLSDEEIQQSLQSLFSTIQRATRNEDQELRIFAEWVPKLLTHPGMIYVEDFSEKGAFEIKAGGIIDLQEHAARIEPLLVRLFKNAPPDFVKEAEINGNSFRKFDIDGEFSVWLGVVDNYMIAATSEKIAERLMDVKSATRPMWLTELQSSSKVKERSLTMYVNVAKIIERSVPPDQIPPTMDSMLGINSLESFSILSGFDDAGYLSHGKLKTKQDRTLGKVFDIFSEKPVTPETFGDVPADATLAIATRLDPGRFIASQREILKDSPEDLVAFNDSLAEYKEETGLSLEEDIFPAFGDELVIYHSKQEGGLLGGFTAMAKVRDADVAKKLEAILLEQIIPQNDANRWSYGPKYFKSEWQGETIHTFVDMNDFSPFLMPSFCVTRDRVIFSLLPQNIQTILSRGDDFKSLAQSAVIKSQLTDSTSIAIYNDSPEFVKAIYPALQFGLVFLSNEMRLIGLDPGIIPSGEVLMKHLKEDVSIFGQNGENFEYVTRTSVPGLDHLLIVGAGMFIGEANIRPRDIERMIGVFSPGYGKQQQSMNNLKMIGLAMHNYHDVYRTFPAAAMVSRDDRDKADEDKKPLLSWRVHLLPFMEEAALYEEFHLDEPWDSEHNIKLVKKMPKIYRAPGSKAGEDKTNYVTIRSDDSVFPGVKQIALRDILDGSSNTIMVVETTDANAVIWSKPDDLKLDAMHPVKELVGLRKNRFLAALCDGSVRAFNDSMDADTLNSIITRKGGEVVQAWELSD